MSNARASGRVAARRFSSGHAIHAKRRGFTTHIGSYDAPGDGSEIDPFAAADLALTKRVAAKLEMHYPAHPWMVKVSHQQGVVLIKLPMVMKRNEEWVLHISTMKSDPGLKCVMRAAGEILERHAMPRHGFALDAFLAAREKGPYGARPKPKLWLPEFASSARPEARLVLSSARS